MATATVRLSQKHFGTGLKYAKRCGGKFNPADKTWDIPADRPELNAPGAYGWIVVAPAAGVTIETDAHGAAAVVDVPRETPEV